MRDCSDDDAAGAGQRGFQIDHDDVPGKMTEAWIQRPALPAWQTSAEWGRDDPQALLDAGPVAVGSALARLVEMGEMSLDRSVRELSALIRDWLESDLGQFDPLDFHLGLKRRDGRRPLAFEAKLAERTRLVIGLSREAPYSGMTATAAAKALRVACSRYASGQWLRDREDRTARPQGERTIWFRVMRLGLHRQMPAVDELAERILIDRGGAEPQMVLPL